MGGGVYDAGKVDVGIVPEESVVMMGNVFEATQIPFFWAKR